LRRRTEALMQLEGAGVGRTTPDRNSPSSQDTLKQLAKILESHVFEKSERMRRFLRFVVERKLAGKESEITEYNLALEVYDRTDKFDQRLNSIVRVDAARLRSKLGEYYETEGKIDVIHIRIPKGTYIPIVTNEKAVRSFDHESKSFARRTGKAIAIIPFLDFSPQRDQWQFGRGLAEELSFSLSRIPQLSVLSSISVLALKRRRLDVPRIGRRLGLDAIIEGSIRKSNAKFRIVVRLTDASNGYQLWSEAFERKVGDVLSLQKEIATLVSKAVRIKLRGDGTPETSVPKKQQCSDELGQS
jgi:TolB-like protein